LIHAALKYLYIFVYSSEQNYFTVSKKLKMPGMLGWSEQQYQIKVNKTC